MAYDGFYGDLSTRGTVNDILNQALAVQAVVVPLAAQVEATADEVQAVADTIYPLIPLIETVQEDADAAAASALSAATSASSASGSASSAASDEDLAHKWAQNPVNVPVEGGEYSAFHWAQMAEEVVTGGGDAIYVKKANNLSDLTNVSTARTNLGLGTAATSASSSFQPADATLTALAGLTTAANTLPYATGVDTFTTTPLTTFGRSLIDDADATTARTTLVLGNVDNTSDVNKPVSTAQQTALNLKANLASPPFTGTPTAPTATVGTNTTQVATTAFVLANAGSGGGSPPLIHVTHTVSAGTSSGSAYSSGIWNTRTFNTVNYNTLSGSSLSANNVTLPAGTYLAVAVAPYYSSGTATSRSKVRLMNTTDNVVAVAGISMSSTPGATQDYDLSGVFTISASKSVRLDHYLADAAGLPGLDTNASTVEVYGDLKIWKIA